MNEVMRSLKIDKNSASHTLLSLYRKGIFDRKKKINLKKIKLHDRLYDCNVLQWQYKFTEKGEHVLHEILLSEFNFQFFKFEYKSFYW